MLSTLVIYKCVGYERYFIIPDNMISDEDRSLMRYADYIDDPESIVFTDPIFMFTEKEILERKHYSTGVKSWSIIKDGEVVAGSAKEAEENSERYEKASLLVDQEGKFSEYEVERQDIKNVAISQIYSWQYEI